MIFQKPKYYRDCSHLKMDVFLEILKTKDLNLLCYYGKPKSVELKTIWESIELEYENLTGNPKYYAEISAGNEECVFINRINGLVVLYDLMRLNPDKEFEEYKTYWEIEGIDLIGLKTTILRERTRYEISKDQEEARKKLKESKPITIERLKIIIESALNKDYIDFSKITVTEWVEMCKVVEEKSNEQKRLSDAKRTD